MTPVRLMSPGDVEAGRSFVKAYVEYVHYVERLHTTATAEVTAITSPIGTLDEGPIRRGVR